MSSSLSNFDDPISTLKRKNLSMSYNKTVILNRRLQALKEENYNKVKAKSERR
mgnify:CR=1 FL=1